MLCPIHYLPIQQLVLFIIRRKLSSVKNLEEFVSVVSRIYLRHTEARAYYLAYKPILINYAVGTKYLVDTGKHI